MEEAAISLGDFGLSLIKLAKFEAEQGTAISKYTHENAATSGISADARKTGMVRFVYLEGHFLDEWWRLAMIRLSCTSHVVAHLARSNFVKL